MKRGALPAISVSGEVALNHYEQVLRTEEDLSAITIRNYLSDLRQFALWYEVCFQRGQEEALPFTPIAVATPTLTVYRAYLQHVLHLKSASVNRSLVSLKRYFVWLAETGQIKHNPAKVVKLVEQEVSPPRHLSDQEEQALVAAATEGGSLRDRTIIVLMLHTGLRASEVCMLTRSQVKLGKRSGTIQVLGTRNKYREIPLNATARVGNVSTHDLRHRFGYRMAESVPLHRLAQLMGHDSLDTTMISIRATRSDLQKEVEKIAWV